MSGERLKQLRLARGLSLEALAAELGGIITKQALSKYEQGKAQPAPRIRTKLAAVLGVKAAHLFSEPDILIRFIAYRKQSRLPKREQERIKSCVGHSLEERVWLQNLIYAENRIRLPVLSFKVTTLEDAEQAAETLRDQWELGLDPIANVTRTLEDNFVHVLDIETQGGFDGISAIAYETEGQAMAAAAVTRSGIAGERQRLNLLHELGHLVLKVAETIDEEKAAFRFGAAFLAPAELIYQEVGRHRTSLSLEELMLLKLRFGMSLQAFLFRLRDLGIINESLHRDWCIWINKQGWRKQEPQELPSEQPQWLRQSVLRALAEKLITHEKAEELLKEIIAPQEPLSHIERRAFMRLPLAERKRILAEQAETMVDFYEQDTEWREIQEGAFIDY